MYFKSLSLVPYQLLNWMIWMGCTLKISELYASTKLMIDLASILSNHTDQFKIILTYFNVFTAYLIRYAPDCALFTCCCCIRVFMDLLDPFHIITVAYRPNEVTLQHYSDVTMGSMASQITSLTIVYSTVYSGVDQRKHQSSASLAFVRGISAQMASNAENVSIWWRHHEKRIKSTDIPYRNTTQEMQTVCIHSLGCTVPFIYKSWTRFTNMYQI